jgi:hypothetical protein
MRCTALLDGVGEITLLFETTQDGADRGFLEDAALLMELFANLFGRGLPALPDHTQDGLFEFAEFGRVVVLKVAVGIRTRLSATVHSATDCSINEKVSASGKRIAFSA